MTMIASRTLTAIALVSLLPACNTLNAADGAVSRIGGATTRSAADQAAMLHGGVFTKKTPYFGQAVLVQRAPKHGTALPRAVEGVHGFAAQLHHASIAQIADLITQRTNI
ncbi:hypothetical protein FGG78_42530, partial [Thioclava sp. BHET1]